MLAKNALTTLERVKMMLDLQNDEAEQDSQTDLVLELMINKASAWVERQIGRHLGRQSYSQWYEADGQRELVTLEYPIVSVEFIKEGGSLVDPSLYDYTQTGDVGVIYRDTGWLKSGYCGGLADDILRFKRNIEVSYTAGYVLPKDATKDDPQTLPADLEGLVLDMALQGCTDLQHGARGLKRLTISDVTWDFDKSTPSQWQQIINLYKRY